MRTSFTKSLVGPILVALIAPATAVGQCELKLFDPEGVAEDRYGLDVAIDGTTALVTAPWEDAAGHNSGAAHVYVLGGSGWEEQAVLIPNDADADDEFGSAVAIDGDTVVVGAYTAGSEYEGFAYVFVREGELWTQQAKLVPGDAGPWRHFGLSVAIDGDRIAVGAPEEGYTGEAGWVYVFERNAGAWSEVARVSGADAETGNWFGTEVALDGDWLAAGCPFNDEFRGAVYVFQRVAGAWVQHAKLAVDGALENDQLGNQVALRGDLVLTGAIGTMGATGAAHTFRRTDAGWIHEGELVLTGIQPGDGAGWDVEIEADRLVVGVLRGDGATVDSGTVHLFENVARTWQEIQVLQAVDGEPGALFGGAVGVSKDRILVGAHAATGAIPKTGAAHVFDTAGGGLVRYCTSQPNSTGEMAVIEFEGTPSLSRNDAGLYVHSAPPLTFGVFLYGTEKAQLPLGAGTLCISPFAPGIHRLAPVAFTNGAGAAWGALDFGVAGQGGEIEAGTTWNFQFFFRDPSAGTLNLSDAIAVGFCP